MSLSVFAASADAPGRPALVHGNAVLSYAQLAREAARATGWLREHGIRPDSSAPVALVAENSLPAAYMLHALIAIGAPVHLLHPRLSDVERDALLARIHPTLVVDGDWYHDDPEPEEAPAVIPDDERTLAVVYTSGTAGAPKGVVLSRRAFVASARASAANLGWRDDDRWLLRLPLAHVGGLSILTRCLLARRAIVLPDGATETTRALAQTVERQRVTLLSLVPTLLRRLLDLRPAWDPPNHLRAMLLGGAAAPADLLERAAERGWPVLTTYGMTETCSQVATQRYGTVNRGAAGSGRPLPGVQLRLVDEEIQVRGPMLCSGYFPPGAVAEPFLADGWFATGDLGRIDRDGNLHVTGRRGDLIVTGGENVDPLEIEQALRSLEGVSDACVFGLPDAEWGSRVCAAIVRAPGARIEVGAIDAELRQRLADFKRPRDYALVEELPLNATGKPDRRAAAERFAARLATVALKRPRAARAPGGADPPVSDEPAEPR